MNKDKNSKRDNPLEDIAYILAKGIEKMKQRQTLLNSGLETAIELPLEGTSPLLTTRLVDSAQPVTVIRNTETTGYAGDRG